MVQQQCSAGAFRSLQAVAATPSLSMREVTAGCILVTDFGPFPFCSLLHERYNTEKEFQLHLLGMVLGAAELEPDMNTGTKGAVRSKCGAIHIDKRHTLSTSALHKPKPQPAGLIPRDSERTRHVCRSLVPVFLWIRSGISGIVFELAICI